MRRQCLVGVMVLAALTGSSWAAAPVYIGVLEPAQLDPTPRNSPVIAARHVRIAFRRTGTTWQPMPMDFNTEAKLAHGPAAYPSTLTWTVVFNARALGTITSQSPVAWTSYGDTGTHQLITPNAPAVLIPPKSLFYSSGIDAKTRPLLLVSGLPAPARWDPDGWKPSPLTPQERPQAVAALRSKVATSERCPAPEQGPVRRVPYPDTAVTVVKSYRSQDGRVLFGVRLNDPQNHCGFFDDPSGFDYWFVRDATGLHYLDSQMVPLEAADLDGSGHASWLFFTARGEDTEGYVLFYDGFRRRAQFQWTYH